MALQRVVIPAMILVTYACAGRVIQNNYSDQIGKYCVGCICEAASYCDANLRCVGQVCGAFAITHDYWIDAGKITLNEENPNVNGAWTRCVNDLKCASDVLKSYMYKYARDCNGDGEITCVDYARIHRLGPKMCNGSLDTGYKEIYDKCEYRLRHMM